MLKSCIERHQPFLSLLNHYLTINKVSQPMTEQSITPTYDWNLKNCRVKIDDPDTRAWAEFVINNLTKSNKDVLQGTLPVTLMMNGWLSEDTAMMFSSIIEDRWKAMVKAVDNGKLKSKTYPSLGYQRERHVVGAAICELMSQGYDSEFFKSLENFKLK